MQIEENITRDELINLIKFEIQLGLEFFSEIRDFSENITERKFKDIPELENFLCKYFTKNNFNFVPSIGKKNSKVLLIGNKLGDEEILEKSPYVGNNKILLEKMLNAIDLDINDVYKLNIDNSCDYRLDFNDILSKYLEFLEPQFIINMSKRDINSILATKLNNNFFSVNIPDPSLLIKNPSLKRVAWENLKKLRLKLIDSKNK